jgi:cytochrome b
MNKRKEYPMVTKGLRSVTVWDPLVRMCHWLLVVAFFVAYFTEDDLLTVHVWAGYIVGFVVALRVLWGFVGPKHARFSDFIFGPWKVWSYLMDLVYFRAERYMGHSPAGGAMVLALLIGLAATVWSGLETYAIEENSGPLAHSTIIKTANAGVLPSAPLQLASGGDDRKKLGRSKRKHRDDNGDDNEEGFWEEVHEVLADLMLILVIIHVLGVGLASVVHRENLIRAIITGKKRIQ